uniref:Uncharacterized protein n=1 Tax=Sus scrofa TaxID=9823 RepID=A0A287AWM1_PIG
METQRASLCWGALSYREAVLRAVDRLNEQSSESHLPTLILDQDEDPGTPKPVSFTVRRTVCPGRPGMCGTVTLDQIKDPLDITCNEVSGPLLVARFPQWSPLYLSERRRFCVCVGPRMTVATRGFPSPNFPGARFPSPNFSAPPFRPAPFGPPRFPGRREGFAGTTHPEGLRHIKIPARRPKHLLCPGPHLSNKFL